LKKYIFLVLGIILMLILTTCSANADTIGDPFVVDLIAGENKDIGNVSIWNDKYFLYVQINTTDNWFITQTHLHVATSFIDLPQTKKGNPIPGQFDFKNDSHDSGTTGYLYKVPLNSWTIDDVLFIAVHAVVIHSTNGYDCEESAWGEGFDFPGKNWAMYFNYIITQVVESG
jgi:hypothetical protein